MYIESVNKLLYSDTNLPDIFIAEYLPNLDGTSIKVYITCLLYSKNTKKYTKDEIAKKLSLPVEEVEQALVHLDSIGLITRKEDKIVINDIKEIEINKNYSPKVTSAVVDALDNTNKNKKRNKVINQINRSFFQGMMPPSWYTDIDIWFARYGFEEDVMLMLFQYCYEHTDGLNKRYITTVAQGWADHGVVNLADYERYSQENERYKDIRGKIAKKLKRRSMFTEYEEAYISKWVYDYGYSFDVIEQALMKTVNKPEASIKYVDAILTNWHNDGVKSVSDIKNAEKKYNDKKNSSKSEKDYDKYYTNLYKDYEGDNK